MFQSILSLLGDISGLHISSDMWACFLLVVFYLTYDFLLDCLRYLVNSFRRRR